VTDYRAMALLAEVQSVIGIEAGRGDPELEIELGPAKGSEARGRRDWAASAAAVTRESRRPCVVVGFMASRYRVNHTFPQLGADRRKGLTREFVRQYLLMMISCLGYAPPY
jgi:hypothetical protein